MIRHDAKQSLDCRWRNSMKDRFSEVQANRVPLHCTASGKAVLAALRPDEFDRYLAQATLTRFTANTIVDERVLAVAARQIREEGYAFTQDEWTIGITAVFTAELQEQMIEHVRATAQALSGSAASEGGSVDAARHQM